MNNNNNKLGKGLFVLFKMAWGNLFTQNFPDDSFVDMWCADWGNAIAHIDQKIVMNAHNHLKINSEWPPSMAKFIKTCDELCAKDEGLPDFEIAYKMAIDRNFSVPEVAEAFKCMDDWTWKNCSDKDGRARFSKAWNKTLERKRTQQCTGKKELPHDNQPGLEEDWRAQATSRRRDARKEIEGNVLFGKGLGECVARRLNKTNGIN